MMRRLHLTITVQVMRPTHAHAPLLESHAHEHTLGVLLKHHLVEMFVVVDVSLDEFNEQIVHSRARRLRFGFRQVSLFR